MVSGASVSVLSRVAGCKEQSKIRRFSTFLPGIALFFAFGVVTCSAQLTRSVTLAWDPSPALDLVGYRLYYGTAKGAYAEVIDLPPITQITVPELLTQTAYYFAVTALNIDGVESRRSNELLLNSPPTINSIPTQFVEPDQPLTLPLRVGDVETAPQFLYVAAEVNNPSVLPLSRITFQGMGTDRSVTLAPLSGSAGQVQVTLTVFDANDTWTSTSFTVVVSAGNSPPAMDPVEDRIVPEDSRFQSILLTGITPGAAGELQVVAIEAHSSRPDIIPDPLVLYPAASDKAYLYYRPLPNAYGTAIISVVLNDSQPKNNLSTYSFSITVAPVNDPPTFGPLNPVRLTEDSVISVPLTLYDLENRAEDLRVTATANDTNLFPAAGLQFMFANGTRWLQVRPGKDQFGLGVITVTATDLSGASSSASLAVEVTPVNDPPTLNPLGHISMVAGSSGLAASPFPIGLFGISPGAPNENESITVTAFSSNPSLIPHPTVSYQSGATSGFLNILPLTDTAGKATITVIVAEPFGGATFSRAFNVTVLDFSDLLPDVPAEVTVTNGLLEVPFTAYGGSAEPLNFALSVSSLDPLLIPTSGLLIFDDGPRRHLLIAPTPGRSGTALVALTADGDGDRVTRYIRVTIQAALVGAF